MKRPAALCGFTVFLCLMFLCGHDSDSAVTALLIFAFLFSISVLFLLLGKKRFAALSCAFAVTLSGMFASAMYLVKYRTDYLHAARSTCESKTAIHGIVYDTTGYADGKYTYIIRLSDSKCKLELSAYADLYLSPGDVIDATMPYIRMESADAMQKRNMAEGVYLYSDAVSELRTVGKSNRGIYPLFAGYRLQLKNRILRIVGGDAGGLLCGMILGDTSAMSLRAENSFMRCGINHIFCVSGFHVSAWSALLLLLLEKLRCGRISKAVAASGFSFLVCAVTGFPLSGLRAAFMLCCVYLSKCFRLESDMLNSLGAALLVICSLNPFAGGSISLLFSVAATVGIVLFAEWVSPPVSEEIEKICGSSAVARILNAAVSVLLLSMSVTAVLMPISVYLFGKVSPAAPLANLLLVSFSEIAMMTGGISAVSHFRFGLRLAGVICKRVLWAADKIASLTLSSVKMTLMQTAIVFAIAGLICLILYLCRKKKIAVFFVSLIFVLSAAVSMFDYAFDFNKVKITALRTEELAVLVQYRDKNILIAGNQLDSRISNTLSEHFVYNLDTLLLFDSGDLPQLSQAFEPTETIKFTETYAAAYYNGLTIRAMKNGYLLTTADCTIAAVFSEPDSPQDSCADILIVNRLEKTNTDLSGYDRVYVCEKGIDTGNIHYINNREEEILCRLKK